MMMSKPSASKIFIALCVLALAACASDPLPDYRYYKTVQTSVPKAFAQSLIASALEIEPLRADGVFGERPIVYSFADEPQKLSQYHYQLWTDPPGTWIQRRMIDRLILMNIADTVTARANVRERPAKMLGLIEELQRIKQNDGRWQVLVSLRIRVDLSAGRQRLLEKSYRRSMIVNDDSMASSVEAFGAVIDEITDSLAADVQAAVVAKAQ
jgi:ABC-type uncharacterized transport system auxiliary subunit